MWQKCDDKVLSEMPGKRNDGAAPDRRVTSEPLSSVQTSLEISDPRPMIHYILSHSGTDRRPYLDVHILGKSIKGILDSGCSVTCMGADGLEILIDLGFMLSSSSTSTCRVANNQECSVLGRCTVPIEVQSRIFITDILIVPDLSHTLILGIDFWIHTGIIPNLKQDIWHFDATETQVALTSVKSKETLQDDERQRLDKLTQKILI